MEIDWPFSPFALEAFEDEGGWYIRLTIDGDERGVWGPMSSKERALELAVKAKRAMTECLIGERIN